jgi:hypothetical protein
VGYPQFDAFATMAQENWNYEYFPEMHVRFLPGLVLKIRDAIFTNSLKARHDNDTVFQIRNLFHRSNLHVFQRRHR